MTLADYLPIVLMAALGVGFAAISLWMSWRLAPNNPTPEKLAPYECGIVPLQDPVERFPVKFYLVAMLFVIFDVEIVFLFAWAVRFEQLAWAGVAAMAVFVALLVETLVYVWKRGALDWNVARRGRYRQVVADGAAEPGTSSAGAGAGVGEAA
jgi:NADH-quinone oxidoreductase subunit A